jgi:hypothetical protein
MVAGCALADADPLATVRSTGWPHAEVPLSVMANEPQDWWPAAIPACVQVAPVEVDWQLQPEPRPAIPAPPPPLPEPLVIEAPVGRVIVTMTCPVDADPVSAISKTTSPPTLGCCQVNTLTLAASCADGAGEG